VTPGDDQVSRIRLLKRVQRVELAVAVAVWSVTFGVVVALLPVVWWVVAPPLAFAVLVAACRRIRVFAWWVTRLGRGGSR